MSSTGKPAARLLPLAVVAPPVPFRRGSDSTRGADMAIRLSGSLVGGFGPRHFAFETRRTLAKSVRAGVEAATLGLKTQMRDEVVGVGLGVGLANAVGHKIYPEGARGAEDTLHPAGMVFPRGKLASRIFEALNEGKAIRARNARYLALPTRNAWLGGQGGKRPSPEEFTRRTGIRLFSVESKRRGVLLLMGRKRRGKVKGSQSVVYFILVPMVRPGPRLSFEAMAQRWANRIPDFIERATPEGLR